MEFLNHRLNWWQFLVVGMVVLVLPQLWLAWKLRHDHLDNE